MHEDTDQFIRLDAGKGRLPHGADEGRPQREGRRGGQLVRQVPAGTWHDIVNTGDEPMQLYVIYAPSHHAKGKVHKTEEDSRPTTKAGTDEPPAWTVQPDE